MDINKDILIKICILLIIIIILRFLYIRLTENTVNTENTHLYNNIEKFEVNNDDAIDLLSKLKNSSIIPLDPNNTSTTIIKPWTTKIYNMEYGNQQVKPVALYQPKLLIKDIQYCKLGDMLCQNSDYSPPDSNHFTLLIKKGSSDIKPPDNYDLIVNFGDETVNTKYYDYESYITSASSQSQIYSILPNIINCSNIFNNINTLIQNNLEILGANLSNQLTKTLRITINKKQYNILGLINTKNVMNFPLTESEYQLPVGLSCKFTSNQYTIDGVNKGFNNTNPIPISFNLPSTLESLQTNDKTQIASYIPGTLFKNIDENNIIIEPHNILLNTLLPITSIINLIQTLCYDINTIYNKHSTNPKFLTYLNLIDNTQNIKIILDNIDNFNNFMSQYNDSNNITLNSNPELQTYFDSIVNINCGSSIVGHTLNLLKNFTINYKITYISFTESNIIYPTISSPNTQTFVDIPNDKNTSSNTNDVIEPFYDFLGIGNAFEVGFKDDIYETGLRDNFAYKLQYGGNTFGCGLSDGTATQACIDGYQGSGGGDGSGGGGGGDGSTNTKADAVIQLINHLQLVSFTNDFVSNLPQNSLNINFNQDYRNIIKTSMKNITDFTLFINDLQNNTVKNLPLKIYKPIAPKGYKSLGHIFCNLQTQLDDIKINDAAGNGTCCVPENCVKDIRDWNISDKIFEYDKNSIYWAIYYNPYTGTFISTNTNNFPDGKVCKVVACVKKCNTVDELKKADECIRNYYNMNKKHNVKIAPDLVSDTEEEYYLSKVKTQSDTITKLFKRANNMQLDMDKATIVNAELNKNKLQTYVDTQKRNIDIVSQRLIDDDDKIETNVNIPINVLNDLITIIKNSKKLTPKQKTVLTDKLIDNKKMADTNIITKGEYDKNLNKIMSNCPDYDLTGLVKKDVVSNVCYGCTT